MTDDLDGLRAAAAAVSELGDEPRGALRLHVSPTAENFLGGSLLAGFLAAHPHVQLDLFLSDEPLDIVDVHARVLTNDPALNIRLARSGAGLTLADDRVRDDVARGELVQVLEEFSTPYPGFYLYYPQRRHTSPPLRAFIDYLRRARAVKQVPGA